MFSVEQYDRAITASENQTIREFIRQILGTDTSTNARSINRVALGNMMSIVELENRWVYHGSRTTPPCNPDVYWNVVNYIFPILKEDYDRYLAMQASKKDTIGSTTNYRGLQVITTDHHV